MPLSPRRGATLVELIIALILAALVGLALSRFLIGHRRGATRLMAIHEAGQTIDQSAGWMTAELAEIGEQDTTSDLIAVGPDSLTYRAWRMSGIACTVTPAEVRIRRDFLSGWRAPQPGRDSLALLLASDSEPWRDVWTRAPLNAVSASECAGHPALVLSTQIEPSLLSDLPAMVPVRTFEVMQLRLYRSMGEWWLGARSLSAGEGIQPLTGPFAEQGVRLSYADSAGSATTNPSRVERLQLSLTPSGYFDSARVFLSPRNLP